MDNTILQIQLNKIKMYVFHLPVATNFALTCSWAMLFFTDIQRKNNRSHTYWFNSKTHSLLPPSFQNMPLDDLFLYIKTARDMTKFLWPDTFRHSVIVVKQMTGWIRHSLGSRFWLRHIPFSFTTIQARSYKSPWGPKGHSVTCRVSHNVWCSGFFFNDTGLTFILNTGKGYTRKLLINYYCCLIALHFK